MNNLFFILIVLIFVILVWYWVSLINKPSRHIPKNVKKKVLERYFNICAVCNEENLLEFHHKIPFSETHDNSEKNIVPLCPFHHNLITRYKKK